MKIIKIKIKYNNANVLTSGSSQSAKPGFPEANCEIKKCLYVKSHVFTKTERDYIKNNVIYKKFNASMSLPPVSHRITNSETTKTIDLNEIDLNCSHIFITVLNSKYYDNSKDGLTIFGKAAGYEHGSVSIIDSIDLKINGSSVYGGGGRFCLY